MSVGRSASDRASRGGMSAGVGAEERADFLRESHDGIAGDFCCCSCVEGLAFFSASKRSRNFWISGSVFGLEGVDVEGEGGVVDVVGGVSLAGADDFSSLGGDEDHSQPIAMFYVSKNQFNVLIRGS